MAPDVTWELTGRPKDHPALGRRKEPNGVREFFGVIADTQDSVSFAPREFHPSGDLVFVLGNYVWKMRKTGKSVDSNWVHIFTVKNGKVAAFREFNDTAQFAEAFRG